MIVRMRWQALHCLMKIMSLLSVLDIQLQSGIAQSLTPGITRYVRLCEGQWEWVQCENPGHVIYVENAYYGRLDNYTCLTPGNSVLSTSCLSEKSSQTIWQICNRKNRCRLVAQRFLYQDPCMGASAYLYMKYRCSPSDVYYIGSCPTNFWTDWINDDTPKGYGDFEQLSMHKRAGKIPCDNPIGLEVRLVSDEPYVDGGDVIRSSLNYGATCVNKQQSDDKCNDYKVRYCCSARCKRPRTPVNGFLSPGITQDFAVGTRLAFSCRRGFELIGSPRPECLPDSTWSSEVPFCRRKVIVPEPNLVRYCVSPALPHFKTFDGREYKFGGVCKYTLLKVNDAQAGTFSVEVDNDYRKEERDFPWLRKLTVRVFNREIEMSHGRSVKVDGVTTTLPYRVPSLFQVYLSGRFAVLTTQLKLIVIFDGRSFVAVGLPQKYDQAVEGLCGNYNGDPSDDFLVKGGHLFLNDTEKFGGFHRVPTTEGCNDEVVTKINKICLLTEYQEKHHSACSTITDRSGPLGDCVFIYSDWYYKNCLYDMCVHNGAREALEQAVAAFVESCQRERISLKDWRTITNTPLVCPAQSSYRLCSTRCPNTCSNRKSSLRCTSTCVEGCVCEDGYIFSGAECIPSRDCGCLFEGKYYKHNEVLFSWGCRRRCTCTSGNMLCVSHSCKPNEKCDKDIDGFDICKSTEIQSCRAWGAPHYMTFDGSGWFDFQGFCSYTMSETFTLPTTDSRWFSVQAESDSRVKNNRFLYLKKVIVRFFGKNIKIVLDKNGTITVNDNKIKSARTDLYTIKRSGLSTVVSSKHGLEVSFTGKVMHVKLQSNYMEKVRGLCGDYNGDAGNDLLTPAGTVANSYDEFVIDYQLGSCQSQLATYQQYTCSPSDANNWATKDYCGALSDPEGPFKNCHSTVNLGLFSEKCIFDVCVTKGDETVLLQAFEEYVYACKHQGVDLCDWRIELKKPKLDCPSHSTYKGCAPSCQDSCFDPYASVNCQNSTVEDCVCDFGYLQEGNRCIPKYECGCVDNGFYVAKGESLKKKDLNLECKCLGMHEFLCSCLPGYTPHDGRCVDIDECLQPRGSVCHYNADCFNTNGSYYCVCKEGLQGNGRTCTVISCLKPPSPPFGRIIPDQITYLVDSRINYVCQLGYKQVGNSYRVCQSDGTWANKVPECRRRTSCDRPPRIRGGRFRPIRSNYPSGSIIAYKCFPGMKLVHGPKRKCRRNTWSGLEPKCLAVCTRPDPVWNVNLFPSKPRYIAGDKIQYKCDQGFLLMTTPERTCQDNGTWSGEAPVCEKNICDPPPTSTNGIYFPKNIRVWRIGTKVTYACKVGFALAIWDPIVTTCLPDKSWSAPPPECIDIDECFTKTCNGHSNTSDASDCVETIHKCHKHAECINTVGSYECKCTAGYSGDGKTNCKHFIPCMIPSHFDNGFIKPPNEKFVATGELISFECDSGFVLEGESLIECQGDGKWDVKFPTCVDRDECHYEPCIQNSTCVNFIGGFFCQCNEGFFGDGFTSCDEIDCEVEECNCFWEDQMYQMGQVFYNKNCTEKCKCSYNVIECEQESCPADETCYLSNSGKYQCTETSKCSKDIPIRKVELPEDCPNERNMKQYYNAGKCTNSACSFNGRPDGGCCSIALQTTEKINCRSANGEYSLSVNKVKECGCQRCIHAQTTVEGRVFGVNEQGGKVPLEFGEVIQNGTVVSLTGKEGVFSLFVQPGSHHILLKFVDKKNNFVPATKLVNFDKDGGQIYSLIQLPLLKSPIHEIETDKDWEMEMGNVRIHINPSSFFHKSGKLFTGKAVAEIEYISYKDYDFLETVPDRFDTNDGKMLKIYNSMYCVFFTHEGELLNVKNIKLYFNDTGNENFIFDTYSRSHDTGLWQEESRFQNMKKSAASESTVNISGEKNIISIATVEEKKCYMKVHGYTTNAYEKFNKLGGLTVKAIYMKKDAWYTAVNRITTSMKGACLPVICSEDTSYTAVFAVSINTGVNLKPDESTLRLLNDKYKINKNDATVTLEFAKGSKYLKSKGPMHGTEEACMSAPNSQAHLRFYLKSKHVYEFNTIPVDDFDIAQTWYNNPLVWWPKPLDFTTCYIKVGIIGKPVTIRSMSYVGWRSDILGKLYGIREEKSTGGPKQSAACLEFKCSGQFLDGVPDITVLDIEPKDNKCKRKSVNDKLLAVMELNYLKQRSNSSFRMMQVSHLIQGFGIYTHTSADIFVSKQTALNKCNAGDDETISYYMKPSHGLALTFKCR